VSRNVPSSSSRQPGRRSAPVFKLVAQANK
jgi:hypothetical protein